MFLCCWHILSIRITHVAYVTWKFPPANLFLMLDKELTRKCLCLTILPHSWAFCFSEAVVCLVKMVEALALSWYVCPAVHYEHRHSTAQYERSVYSCRLHKPLDWQQKQQTKCWHAGVPWFKCSSRGQWGNTTNLHGNIQDSHFQWSNGFKTSAKMAGALQVFTGQEIFCLLLQ